MKFNGLIGDMGSKDENETVYEMSYLGSELEPLKTYVRKRCEEKGVEVLGVSEGREGERWKVTARVKSLVGII